jgi:hypothetical protein
LQLVPSQTLTNLFGGLVLNKGISSSVSSTIHFT